MNHVLLKCTGKLGSFDFIWKFTQSKTSARTNADINQNKIQTSYKLYTCILK